MKAKRRERGIVKAVKSAALTLPRKKNRTVITISSPSKRVCDTV